MNENQTYEQLSKATATFRRLAGLDDVAVYKGLVAEGMDRQLAARIVEFLPMAYGRLLMAKSGARFSDSFRRRLPTGGLSEPKAFSSEPVWNMALSFARAEIERSITKKDFLFLAGRSAEFQVANGFLNQGRKLDDLVFTPPLLPWSDEGPEDRY
jgi:hypothetical protein